MYDVTDLYLETIRGGHRAWGYCEGWYGGQRLQFTDDLGNPATRLPLDVKGQNEVAVDGSTPGVRRTLTATLGAAPGLWDLLSPVGTELRAYTVLRYPTGAVETVPQGVHPIDLQRLTYGPKGQLSLTAPDRWSTIQNARFLTPRQFGGGTVRQLITKLLLEALPAGTVVSDLSTSTATVPTQTEDRDRAGLIQKLATAASLDVYFDRNGNPVIRDAPQISSTPVWSVDAGPSGVLVSADRQRDRRKTYNLVVVNDTSNNGSAPLATQYVWDNDPNSPTYCGPGVGFGSTPPAVAAAGPFGQRPTFLSSPLFTSTAQMVAAGLTRLARVTGLAAQLTAAAVSNSALDDGDTIRAVFPRSTRSEPRPTELHIIDSLTVPLVPSANAQQITTRSTRADDVEES